MGGMTSLPHASDDFLTVEEAAAVLRIGRTAAYEATRAWRETDGAEGIPVVKIGGSLRVPRRRLEALAGGPITVPTSAPPSAPPPAPAALSPVDIDDEQPELPFSA